VRKKQDDLNLSDREREILLLAAEGLTDKEISRDLGITESTISTHWVRMREKTKCANRAQLIAQAVVSIYRSTAAELQRTSELYRILIDTLSDFAVFITDPERRVISWHPGVERIIGYTEQEWIGRSGDDLFTQEDGEKGEPVKEAETALREGRAQDERWHVRKDGSLFWASGVQVPLFEESGRHVGFAKVIRDNTYCKRLEDEVQRLGGKIPEPSGR
jgi:PAS domain S-box-containing protein